MNSKEVNCVQGSADWFKARCGKPTASRFDCIITELGKAAKNKAKADYFYELIAERLTLQSAQHFTTAAMERGTLLEPEARKWYAAATNRDVRQVGFIDAGRWGCSPDGLCADRGVEIKCPMTVNMVRLLLAEDAEAAADYQLQCQAGMWIAGLPFWDLVLYSGQAGLPNRIITLNVDAKLHEAFAQHVPAFCAEVDAAEGKLRAAGGGYTMRDQYAELTGEEK